MKILFYILILFAVSSNLISQKLTLSIKTSKTIKHKLSDKVKHPVYGLEVSGSVVLEGKDSYVQVLIRDTLQNKFLVQEFYYPLYFK